MRFPLLLLLGAIAAFALAFVLWPGFSDGDPGLPVSGPQDPGAATSQDEQGDDNARRVVSGQQTQAAAGNGVVHILVTTSAGLPLEGCEVKVGKRSVSRTGPEGWINAELRAGRHWVEVKPPAASQYGAMRQRVTVVAGETVDARIALPASGGGEIWCRVIAAENGAPIEGAHVVMFPYGSAEATSDQDGLAVLQTEGENEFLVASAEGRALRRFLSTAESFGEDGVLEVALPLSANVAFEVVDAQGEPIVAALVSVAAMPWSLMHPARCNPRGVPETWTAETDESGKCAFADLPASAPLQVEVAATGGGHAVFREPITFQVGDNQRRIELSAHGSIVGRVLDGANTPIPGARVAAVSVHGEDSLEFLPEDSMSMSAISDDGGAFRIEGLDAGAYCIGLLANERWASRAVRVELSAGSSAKADLRAGPALSISGTLTGPGNRAISAFEVHAMRNGSLIGSSVTDKDGAFFIKSLMPGDYEITTELYDQELAMRAPIVVPAGRSGVAVKVVSVMGTLRGRVVGGDSLRPDTFVRAQRRTGPEAIASRCDLDGRFEYGKIREGMWDVHVSDGAGRVGVVSGLKVVAGESNVEAEIALMQGGTLRPMHPTADRFVVLRGGEVAGFGPLERGLPTEVIVPPGKCTVVFYARGREVGRVEANAVVGQHTVVEGR